MSSIDPIKASADPSLRKVFTIVKTLGGGIKDIKELLDSDTDFVNTMYMLCTRSQVAEAFANIPYKDHPSKEELESYIPRNYTMDDFAWSSLFQKALLWLNDRQSKMKKKEREEDFSNTKRSNIPRIDR